MALTAEQQDEVARLRDMTDITQTTDPYTSDQMYAHIVREGSIEQAAAHLWRVKAAGLAGLADVTEGASSRKLSQLHEQALAMAENFDTDSAATTAATRSTRIRQITRD